MDSQLIGAYLVTLSNFCENLMGEFIDCVDSQSMRIQYFSRPDFILALLVDKNADRTTVHGMLERLHYLFVTKYKGQLGPQFDGDIARFEDFADEIETIFDLPPSRFQQFLQTKAERLQTEITELFDFQKRREERLRHLRDARQGAQE